ncbi:Y+L amino acid transporter 2-like [Pomacea canaliculata]|uniref:Y+L amino acid transporter 2-like n=1 Tax=Pomacea canaliculata TaxID=400727 RepID=UPI000D737CFA|nr:Y+L amino acid transporter 2-like [Pomacea canaliculata]
MSRRKGAILVTPGVQGVYRPRDVQPLGTDVPQDQAVGVENAAFEAEIPNGDPHAVVQSTDTDSNSSGFASIEDNSATPSSRGNGGDTNRDIKVVEVVPVKPDAGKGTADVQLKKSINLLHCTAIMVAVTGHSSVFISPAAILGLAGSVGASLVVWLVGGLINLGLALCFAELGTMLPKAGGPYAYVMRTFGPLAGFLIMWGYVVLIAGPFWAFLAYTAALYIVKPAFPECQPEQMDTGVKILAGWIMITMVALNCVYMKYVTKIQTLLSSTKIVALLIIIIAGFYQMAVGNTENLDDIFDGTTQEPGKFAVAIFYSIFSYGGWQVMTSLMEEVKNPGRDLPLSVYITFVIVIIKYILTNVAYYTLITPQELLRSSAIALMFMDRLYRPVSPLISVLVATTSIGALNASIMGHSRLLFAGARNGHMPLLMGMVHPKYLTPWPAIFALLVWSLVMLYSGSVTDMMEFISLFSTIMGIAVVCSLLYLRWKRPNEKRPYKTMLFVPVVQLIINLAVLVLAIYQKPHRMGIGLLILFAGVPVYWLGVLWRSKPKEFTSMIEGITVLIQKALLLTKSQ